MKVRDDPQVYSFVVPKSDIKNTHRKEKCGEDGSLDNLYFRQIWEIQMKLFSLQRIEKS